MMLDKLDREAGQGAERPYYTATEAAALLGVSARTIKRLVQEGLVVAELVRGRTGDEYHIDRPAFDRYCTQYQEQGSEKAGAAEKNGLAASAAPGLQEADLSAVLIPLLAPLSAQGDASRGAAEQTVARLGDLSRSVGKLGAQIMAERDQREARETRLLERLRTIEATVLSAASPSAADEDAWAGADRRARRQGAAAALLALALLLPLATLIWEQVLAPHLAPPAVAVRICAGHSITAAGCPHDASTFALPRAGGTLHLDLVATGLHGAHHLTLQAGHAPRSHLCQPARVVLDTRVEAGWGRPTSQQISLPLAPLPPRDGAPTSRSCYLAALDGRPVQPHFVTIHWLSEGAAASRQQG